MKRFLFAIALMSAMSAVRAQDVQELYDVNRGHLVTTLEYYNGDRYGYTFLFTDIYHAGLFGPAPSCPTEFYTEIGRTFCPGFRGAWGGLGIHGEWNGGIYANNCWLVGPEYALSDDEGLASFTFQAMYKHICNGERNIPVQLTFVWDLQRLFGVKGLRFCGFLDVWGEHLYWRAPGVPSHVAPEVTEWVWEGEPQLWYGVGRFFRADCLSIGFEVRLGYNFSGSYHVDGPHDSYYCNKGFTATPCFGLRWDFQ